MKIFLTEMHLYKFVHHTMQIAEGWIKWIYDMVRREGSTQSLRRLVTCQKCEHNVHGICNECGCIIKAKVRVKYPLDDKGNAIGGCPLSKW